MRKSILLFAIIFSNFLSAQIVINEYSAANFDSYQDNYGEYEDWIEIYNSSATAIDLNGYFLTDKVANPTKWQIPSSFTVPANGVAVIFCSGRDEVSGGAAHTNFKITQTKGNEVIMISDPSQVLLDSVTVRPNIKTHSRGRETDGSGTWSVFLTPTPCQLWCFFRICSNSRIFNTTRILYRFRTSSYHMCRSYSNHLLYS